MASDQRSRPARVIGRCVALAVLLAAVAPGLHAQSLAAKAKESGCVDAPRVVEGRTYRCGTSSGAAAYFNVPGAPDQPPPRTASAGATASAPAGFPKVDAATQRTRDDKRRQVLADELASEEKLLAEARTAYGNGAPPALPGEQSSPQKYAERIAKLRQAVQLHERNVDALRRELGASR